VKVEQLIQLYLQLTGDVRSLWFAFGAVTVIIAGWLLARKRALGTAQRMALSIGWFSVTGYVGSSLMNRYRLLAAVVSDIAKAESPSSVTAAIAEASRFYEHHEVFVYGSLAALSVGAILLIWSNIAVQFDDKPPK
jgi:hypothetical protein